MAALRNDGAAAPGLAAPERAENDKARELGGGAGFDRNTTDGGDFRVMPVARQALCVIEGERKAAEYLARLQAEQADPDELALIVAALYGAALRWFCRVIEKALGVRHA